MNHRKNANKLLIDISYHFQNPKCLTLYVECINFGCYSDVFVIEENVSRMFVIQFMEIPQMIFRPNNIF